jgi:hypothetical protein
MYIPSERTGKQKMKLKEWETQARAKLADKLREIRA